MVKLTLQIIPFYSIRTYVPVYIAIARMYCLHHYLHLSRPTFSAIANETFIGARCYQTYAQGDPSLDCSQSPEPARCLPDNADCVMEYCVPPTNIGKIINFEL